MLVVHTSLILMFVIPHVRSSSLTFVIDDSGSMEDDIEQVRRGANGIMDIVLDQKASQIGNIVLVTFNDPVDLITVKKTRDRDVLRSYLNSIRAHNTEDNNDWPEYSLSGLERALEESSSGSYIFVFTDASAKDFKKVHVVIDLCQRTQSQVVFILTDYCYPFDEEKCLVYYEIAKACSGQVFRIDKNEVEKVLIFVRETIKGEKTVIKAVEIPANVLTDVPFIVDDKTEYVIVSTSGTDVYLDVRGPTATKENQIWSNNVKVIKLSNPTPGTYTATAKGSSHTTVTIIARTDFLFEHGFSELKPKSLSDTSKQPIAGSKSHLSVLVKDPDHSVKINSVELLNMKDEMTHEILLQKISGDFYTTEQFVSPSTMFKVRVSGTIIKSGEPIKRTARTPVQPQKPKIKPIVNKSPIVTITEGASTDVPYNGEVTLTCKVSAYPKPQIIWKNSKGTVLQSTSSPVLLPYEYISYLRLFNITKPGKYYCHGDNDLGKIVKSVHVVVQSPFTVHEYPKSITQIEYGKKATIRCNVQSFMPMQINWFVNDTKLIKVSDQYSISMDGTELSIKFMDLDLVGKYTCKASLISDGNKKEIYDTNVKVIGLAAPKINPNPAIITTRTRKSTIIPCRLLQGNPKPTITWQFKPKNSDKFMDIDGTGEELHIASTALTDSGHYMCLATNIIGKDQRISELIVEAPPTIILKDIGRTYNAVEGDVVLRIPCKVTGYPKPVVTWKISEKSITSGDKYSIEDGALVIKHPAEKDTQNYTCKATNDFGEDKQTFVGVVTSDLEYGKTRDLFILKGETTKLKCPLPHTHSDSVRWYLNGQVLNVTGSFLQLSNTDGNYTCRVSNYLQSNSETYVVDVGYPPTFIENEYESTINWLGDEKINCDVKAKPEPKVEWIYNDKTIKTAADAFEFDIKGWGQYTCRISNIHGKVERRFNVTSNVCLLNMNTESKSQTPLLLHESLAWPQQIQANREYAIIPSEEKLSLSCHSRDTTPNVFQNHPTKSEIEVTCDHQDSFWVDGKLYKYSDLRCSKKVMPIVIKTGEKCFFEGTEKIRVGFNVKNALKEVYEVCFDKIKNVTLYTSVKASNVNNLTKPADQIWYKYPEINNAYSDREYTCKDSASSCCYAKSQLVEAQDVYFGPAQTSTFIDRLNSIPYWRHCSGSNRVSLESIEDIRRRIFPGVKIWSGTSHYTNINGTNIPRYLWKVIRFDEENAMAIVYVNDPSPVDSDVRCANTCGAETGMWVESSDKFTYCCEIEDFVSGFELPRTVIGE